jgi:Family of unknown function (DUF6188)
MEQREEFITWKLPIIGFQVYGLGFGGRIDIEAGGPRQDSEESAFLTTLSIGGKFDYVDGDGDRHAFDAEEPWHLMTPLLNLRHKIVVEATADNKSRIEILFDDGSTLEAGPDGNYENWEVVGPGGLNLIGMPSGGDPRMLGADDLQAIES